MILVYRNFFAGRFKLLAQLSLLSLLFSLTAVAQQIDSNNAQSKTSQQSVITGRVISESGQPLAGVGVYVTSIGGSPGQRTATDSEGNFKAQGLDPGAYRLFVGSPGYVMQTQPDNPNTPVPYYRPGDTVTLTLVKGGVIAGLVTNLSGEPVVYAPVRAWRIRDAEGKAVQTIGQTRERATDDRGYYRMYGLLAGSYIVSAGGTAQFSGGLFNPYAYDAPTYSPSSTRDTAVEIIVRPDEEATADIRYRGEPGHSISGRINGVQGQQQSGVRLTDIESHVTLAGAGANGDDRTFQLNSIADGDYEISALSAAGPNTDMSVSPSRRISVRGADVTGIELTLAPLASLAGRVSLETDAKLNCGRHRDSALRETVIAVRRARLDEKPEKKGGREKAEPASEPLSFLPQAFEVSPNDKGEIFFRNLFSGPYRLEARLPGGGWYVKSITTGAPIPNIPRDGIALKSGDKVTALSISIAEGGASLRGRIPIADGQQLPAGLRVYLVPTDRENAENVLRFFEASAASDGSFVIRNIAPGKYWVIARPGEESQPGTFKSIGVDAILRGQILKDAEASKKEISLKPCEQSAAYELPWPSPPR